MSNVNVTESEADKAIVESWYERADKFGEDDSVDKFVEELLSKYSFDYGTLVHATTAVAMAALSKMIRKFGLTGFQHGCILHQMIRREFGLGRKIGHRVQDIDNILYPQYVERFTAFRISSDVAELIKKVAQEMIDSDKNEPSGLHACSHVIDHWKRLTTGWLPPGVVVKEDVSKKGF